MFLNSYSLKYSVLVSIIVNCKFYNFFGHNYRLKSHNYFSITKLKLISSILVLFHNQFQFCSGCKGFGYKCIRAFLISVI